MKIRFGFGARIVCINVNTGVVVANTGCTVQYVLGCAVQYYVLGVFVIWHTNITCIIWQPLFNGHHDFPSVRHHRLFLHYILSFDANLIAVGLV